MNVDILQENLLRALVKTSRLVSPRPQLPILQNVLLITDEGRLKIVATNLEAAEVVWAGAKIGKEGGIAVPARTLTELVASLPQATVRLVAEGGALRVSCGDTNATIQGAPAQEFPPVQSTVPKKPIRLDKEHIAAALSLVVFAAATDEGRPLLTGVKIEKKDGDLVLAATDGYRLSVKHTKAPAGEGFASIIPARALSEVVKVSQEEKEATDVLLGQSEDGQVVLSVGDTLLSTRRLDGEYPNYGKIIPGTWTTRVALEKEPFLRAVRSAAIFARDNANIVRLSVTAQKLAVSASALQAGENTVALSVKTDGEGGEIAFNSRFLLDFLANCPQEEFLFEMTGALNPGVFRPAKDESYLHIIMPVRTQSQGV